MPELYPEDQKKVDDYLASLPKEERTSFHPFKLLLVIILVLGVLTAISYFVGRSHGVI